VDALALPFDFLVMLMDRWEKIQREIQKTAGKAPGKPMATFSPEEFIRQL
jgi:hypothetical protein